MDKSGASQEPVAPSTPGLTLASLHSLPTHLLVIETVRVVTEVPYYMFVIRNLF